MNYKDLSKFMSYILRHNPKKFNIKLDINGWTNLDYLMNVLRADRRFNDLELIDIQNMISSSNKMRFEINNKKIRALYGHSIDKKIKKEKSIPPMYLYHGTARRFLDSIKQKGLIPKNRQYVHLSKDIDTALMVGKRRDDRPVILKIEAKRAYEDGIDFYKEKDDVWLCDNLSFKYIKLYK
ncbi:RNA 2'-phosphotransferase [Peptostreptococcaceae bacterium AGR-M142]